MFHYVRTVATVRFGNQKIATATLPRQASNAARRPGFLSYFNRNFKN